MSTPRTFFPLIILLLCLPAVARDWTDSTGQFTMEADFVGVKKGAVALRKPGGETIYVPFAKLSQRDQLEARRLFYLAKFQGKWLPQATDLDGVPLHIDAGSLEVEGDKFTWTFANGKYSGTLRLNLSKSPATVTLAIPGRGARKPQYIGGIFDFEGEVLRICTTLDVRAVTLNGRNPPESFDTKGNLITWTYRPSTSLLAGVEFSEPTPKRDAGWHEDLSKLVTSISVVAAPSIRQAKGSKVDDLVATLKRLQAMKRPFKFLELVHTLAKDAAIDGLTVQPVESIDVHKLQEKLGKPDYVEIEEVKLLPADPYSPTVSLWRCYGQVRFGIGGSEVDAISLTSGKVSFSELAARLAVD